jgi:hypothetical protein
MYSDPALIRKHFVKLSLSDREAALLDALCAYTGEQKAALIRDMVLRKAEEVLHVPEFVPSASDMRATSTALMAA